MYRMGQCPVPSWRAESGCRLVVDGEGQMHAPALQPLSNASFSCYSIPSCLSLMATRNRSSRRESSLMRSVMALVKASWGL